MTEAAFATRSQLPGVVGDTRTVTVRRWWLNRRARRAVERLPAADFAEQSADRSHAEPRGVKSIGAPGPA